MNYNHDRSVKAMEKQRLGEDPSFDEAGDAPYGADPEEKCPSCEEPLNADGECTNVDCSDYVEDEDEDDEDEDDDEEDEDEDEE